MKSKICLIVLVLSTCLATLTISQTNYYIDFESGNNNNTGTISFPWKQSPGDPQATGIPSATSLLPGDTVFLKGGVKYSGQIKVKNSGSKQNPIVYCGNKWPGLIGIKAVIDGADLLTGWTKYKDSIYVVDLPTGYNLSPDSSFISLWQSIGSTDYTLFPSQSPNPENPFNYDDISQFYSVPTSNVTTSTITSPIIFNQVNPSYWAGSSIIFWGSPNAIYYRKIRSYDPLTNTITFDPLGSSTIYTKNATQGFAIYNSKNAMDKKCEYYLDAINRKIYLYPKDSSTINSSVFIAKRGYGIDIQDKSNITIEGFIVQKQGAVSTLSARDALGIGNWITTLPTRKSNIIIRNNIITKLAHYNSGPGGIAVSNADTVLIENNFITNVYQTRGITCINSTKTIVRNNTLSNIGSTSFEIYTCKNSQITGNVIDSVLNRHANGITLYLGCKNILVASNKLTHCITPITLQDGGDLFFINNFVDAGYADNNVNEWGRTNNTNLNVHEGGNIVFVNNTLVRNAKHTSLEIGDCPYSSTFTNGGVTKVVPANTYIAKNNILDGGLDQLKTTTSPYFIRDHNIYLGKNWAQYPKYDWYMEANEQYDTDSTKFFKNPVALDFSLKVNSLAIDSAINPLSFIPTALFPEYDFNKDLAGIPRGSIWDIGAYEFDSNLTSLQNVYKEDNLIVVYPVPFTNEINIKAGAPFVGAIVYIFNLAGQLILKETIQNGVQNYKVNTPSNLSNGMYFIEITDSMGLKYKQKIILTK